MKYPINCPAEMGSVSMFLKKQNILRISYPLLYAPQNAIPPEKLLHHHHAQRRGNEHFNKHLNFQGGFTPATVAPPDAITPGQVLYHYPKAPWQGKEGGRLCHLFHHTDGFYTVTKTVYRETC